MTNPICQYCGKESRLVSGDAIYRNNPNVRKYKDKKFFVCFPCDAYVGVNQYTGKPFGTLANAELRRKRIEAHAEFDRLWKPIELRNITKPAIMNRSEAYQYLADALDLHWEDAHIGKFDMVQCERTIKIAQKMRIPKSEMKEKSLETMSARTTKYGRFSGKLMYDIAGYQKGDESE